MNKQECKERDHEHFELLHGTELGLGAEAVFVVVPGPATLADGLVLHDFAPALRKLDALAIGVQGVAAVASGADVQSRPVSPASFAVFDSTGFFAFASAVEHLDVVHAVVASAHILDHTSAVIELDFDAVCRRVRPVPVFAEPALAVIEVFFAFELEYPRYLAGEGTTKGNGIIFSRKGV